MMPVHYDRRVLLNLTFVFLWILYAHCESHKKTPLFIAGLFPMSPGRGGEIGRGVLPAARLAIEHVNNHPSVLKDYELKLDWSDSKCDMAVGTKIFFDMMFNAPPKIVLFGDACSEVTQPIAESTKYFNILQLSYADTNPLLSSRSTYPNFFRTVPSEADFNLARVAFLKHFNWSLVGTLYQDASTGDSRYANGHSKLLTVLEKSNVEALTQSFADDPFSAIAALKKEDIRIIIGNFDFKTAKKVFCAAFHHNLYGPKYAWILLGGYPPNWWNTTGGGVNCTTSQLAKVVNGHFATDVLPISTDEYVTAANITPSEYLLQYDLRRESSYSKFHGYAYDGIWSIALAVDKLILNTTDLTLNSTSFFDVLKETRFQGVTGDVNLSSGDRVGLIEVQQLQGGAIRKIGEFDVLANQLNLSRGIDIMWLAKDGKPPRDSRLKVLQTLELGIYVGIVILSGCGIVLALIFLAINIHYRKHVHIKMSSPNMNNLIIIGCIITYSAVVLLGADSQLVGQTLFPKMCTSRAWLLAVGFSISFGAMFSKTWRVYSIFANVNMNKKVIKDWILFLVVGVLVLIDIIILTTWQIVDPFHRNVSYQPAVVEAVVNNATGTTEYIPVLEFCVSNHMTIWLALIYSYKGLLLLCGCFLAWETRNVSIPALNDSKYIGMSVYNVVIMCLSGAVISFLLTDKPTAAFIIISIFIIFCTTITLCLVFLPKVIQLKKDPKGEHKRVRAVLNAKKKKPSSQPSPDVPDTHKHVLLENQQYRNNLIEKSKELQLLQEQLGENTSDISSISSGRRAVLSMKSGRVKELLSTTSSNGGICYEDDTSLYSGSSGSNLGMLDNQRLLRQQSSEVESLFTTSDVGELCNGNVVEQSGLPISTSSSSNVNDYGGVYTGEDIRRSRASGLDEPKLNISIDEFNTLRETDILYDDEKEEKDILEARDSVQNASANKATRKHSPGTRTSLFNSKKMLPTSSDHISLNNRKFKLYQKGASLRLLKNNEKHNGQAPLAVLTSTRNIIEQLDAKLAILDGVEESFHDVIDNNNVEVSARDVEGQCLVCEAQVSNRIKCDTKCPCENDDAEITFECGNGKSPVVEDDDGGEFKDAKTICDIIATV